MPFVNLEQKFGGPDVGQMCRKLLIKMNFSIKRLWSPKLFLSRNSLTFSYNKVIFSLKWIFKQKYSGPENFFCQEFPRALEQ